MAMTKASERKQGRTLSVINRLAEASRQRPPEQAIKALSPIPGVTPKTPDVQSQDAPVVMDTLSEPPRLQRKGSRGSLTGSPGGSQGSQTPAKPRTASTGLTPKQTLTASDNQLDIARKSPCSQRSSAFQSQSQRQEDLRAAEAWSQTLANPASRNNNEVCEKFWSEIKSRMMERHGTVAAAFKYFDSSGDGKMSFIEFADMLRMLHLPIEMRISRAMFEKASGGQKDLSLEDFTPLLMERTIQKFRRGFEGFNKKQERFRNHINSFLNQLANSSELALRGAADRLQRKLTVDFCREFWQVLRESLAKKHSDGDLERFVFEQTINATIGSRWSVVEVTFLMRIFDRIDVHRTGTIHLRMLMTTLILISEERRMEPKLGFLFDVFDTDQDGCLLFDQILDMVRCICARRHIVEDAPNRLSIEFQEELAQQDGQRLYECLFWHLHQTIGLDSDIVTWQELWQACENLPDVVSAVVPGFFRIHWVIQPTPEENEVKPAVEQPYVSSGGASTTSHRLGPSPRPGTGDHDHPNVRATVRRPSKGGWHSSGHDTGQGDSRRASKSQAVAWGSGSPQRDRSETAAFKRTVTNRFLTSLRTCGEVRYAELQEGFKSVEELVAGKRDSLVVEDADAPSPTGAATSPLAAATLSPELRPGSAAVIKRIGSVSEVGRPGSSPAEASGRKGARAIQRVSSAPSPISKQLNSGGSSSALGKSDSHHQWTPGRPKSNLGNGRLPGSGAELPNIEPQKWGLEAADRFRLLSSVRSSRNNQRHIKGSCGAGDALGYKCQLCRSQHTMLTSF